MINTESFYIQAAIQLEVVPDSYGYSINEDNIVDLNGVQYTISDAVKVRAEYLKNLYDVRFTRDSILKDTDWVGNTDVPQTEIVTRLKEYRQKLRNITDQIQEGEPLNIVWPLDPRISSTVTNVISQ